MYKANIKGANFTEANIKLMGLPRKNLDTVKGLILLGAKYMKISEETRIPRLIAQVDETGKLRIGTIQLRVGDE
jgi:hypothetical protein